MFDCIERKRRYRLLTGERTLKRIFALKDAAKELMEILSTTPKECFPLDELGREVLMVGIDLQDKRPRLSVKVRNEGAIANLPKEYKGFTIYYEVTSAPTIPDSVLRLYGEQQ